MNAKYIISLCFVINYLVILSVANPEKEIIKAVFKELGDLLNCPDAPTIFVNEITVLLQDGGDTMRTLYSTEEIKKMNENGIDVEKFEEITRNIYPVDYVKSMNERFLVLQAMIKSGNKPAKL